MSAPDALVLILVFGSLGILTLAAAFVSFLVWHQRRWMRTMEERARDREALLDATSVGRLLPWSCASNGTALTLGDAAASLLQVPPETLTHLDHLLARVVEDARLDLATTLRSAPLHEDVWAKVPMLDGNGGELLTRWHFRRREEALKGIIRDITQEERLQWQLLQAQKLEALGTLVGGVAHEFGNILASVEGCTRALERRVGDDPKGIQGARLILDAAARGRDIIGKLLDFSRRDPEQLQAVNLAKVVEDVAAILRPLLGRAYHLVVHQSAELPPVIADSIQLHQALLNLCINARDAMPEGGTLGIRISETRLEANEAEHLSKRPGVFVRVDVEDTGVGIAPEHLAHLFQPFFTTKPPGKGTGLGLAVTHRIAESHGGMLTVTSEVGRGSQFTLWLPTEAGPAGC